MNQKEAKNSMDNSIDRIKPVGKPVFEYDFSICTLVNDKREYEEMRRSFIDAGFSMPSCEYLYIDNSAKNELDAYEGLNNLIHQARGEYILMCHQDILLEYDKREDLKIKIDQLNKLDPNWAVAGNAGAAGPNHVVYNISYPDGTTMSKGKFPLKAQSIDEVFIVLKNSSGLFFSADLSGFHLYGLDICLQAAIKGYHSYVMDFHILHKSRGNKDAHFEECKQNLIEKYRNVFKGRWIQTTTTCFYLPGSTYDQWKKNPVFLFCIRMWNGLKKKI